MKALNIIVIGMIAICAVVEGMRLSENSKNRRLVNVQITKNTDIVNGESIDAQTKKERGIRYNTEF
jgi:hypothetical protein